MVNKIRFNGTEYDSPDEMPPAARAAYDKALELAAQGKSGGLIGGHVKVNVSTKVRFVSDGKTYDSPDQMPPDIRAKYDKAMEQFDKDHNGIPDILEGTNGLPAADSASSTNDPFASMESSWQPLVPSQPVITPDAPINRALLLVAGIAILVLLAAVIGLLAVAFRH